MFGSVPLSPSLRRLQRTLYRVSSTRYPPCLFGLKLAAHEIPMFVYHEVDRESFAADLSFLCDNGYRTIATEELVDVSRRGPEKRVLITFDDARRNFWDVAFPVLKDYAARATLFAPTYWIGGRKEPVDDHMDSIPALDSFMTWDQLRACRNSGLVDIQPHGHRHALVYTSSRLVGFATPESLDRYPVYDWPMRSSVHQDVLGFPALGTPIYEAMPLLSAESRIIEHPGVARECIEFVGWNGGRRFFSRRWFAELSRIHESKVRQLGAPRVLKGSAFQDLIASEFMLSRRIIQIELGYSPTYFAFPWMLGSPSALSLAADCGFKTVFGVGLDFRRARKEKHPLLVFGRFKSDWLRFLPGTGRSALRDVMRIKVTRFLQNQHLAH